MLVNSTKYVIKLIIVQLPLKDENHFYRISASLKPAKVNEKYI